MKKDKNILVVMPVKDEHKKTLEQHSQGNKFIYSSYDNVTQEMVQEANAIIGNVDPFYLQEAKNLEWLQLNSAGADPYVKKGVLPEDVILTNATGAYGPSVAEHMLAVLFSLQKKLHLYRDNQNQCEWQDEGGVMSLCGGTLLIVGLGDIGLYFARLMKNFDYHIIGIKRRPGQVPQDIDELHTMDDLDKLLPKADVVLSVLPDSKATRNIFNKDPLRVRKLLLHKSEINKLIGKTKEKGMAIVPLKVYFKGSLVKVEIGLAKGKKLYDKRQDIAKKDQKREAERDFKMKLR